MYMYMDNPGHPYLQSLPTLYDIICDEEILADFNLAVQKADRQTTKFKSPLNFPAVRKFIDNNIFS